MDGLQASESEGVGLIVRVQKSDVLVQKSSNISEMRKDRGYYGGPIGTHQRTLERYYPPPYMVTSSPNLGVCNPTQNFNHYYLKIVRTFIGLRAICTTAFEHVSCYIYGYYREWPQCGVQSIYTRNPHIHGLGES